MYGIHTYSPRCSVDTTSRLKYCANPLCTPSPTTNLLVMEHRITQQSKAPSNSTSVKPARKLRAYGDAAERQNDVCCMYVQYIHTSTWINGLPLLTFRLLQRFRCTLTLRISHPSSVETSSTPYSIDEIQPYNPKMERSISA